MLDITRLEQINRCTMLGAYLRPFFKPFDPSWSGKARLANMLFSLFQPIMFRAGCWAIFKYRFELRLTAAFFDVCAAALLDRVDHVFLRQQVAPLHRAHRRSAPNRLRRTPSGKDHQPSHSCQRRREDASAGRSKIHHRRGPTRELRFPVRLMSLLSRPDLASPGHGAQHRGWEERGHAQHREHGEFRTFPAASTVTDRLPAGF